MASLGSQPLGDSEEKVQRSSRRLITLAWLPLPRGSVCTRDLGHGPSCLPQTPEPIRSERDLREAPSFSARGPGPRERGLLPKGTQGVRGGPRRGSPPPAHGTQPACPWTCQGTPTRADHPAPPPVSPGNALVDLT